MPKNEEYLKKAEQFWPFQESKNGVRKHWEWLKRWLLARGQGSIILLTILLTMLMLLVVTNSLWLPVLKSMVKPETQLTNSTKVGLMLPVTITGQVMVPNGTKDVKPNLAQNSSTKDNVQPETFCKPLEGKLVTAYGMSYSSTYQDYRFHQGIDIFSTKDDLVKAIQDGTVASIIEDPIEGWTITINHANQLKSSYANISSPEVAVGQKVSKGQNISKVEVEKGILHLAIYSRQQGQNPLQYLSY